MGSDHARIPVSRSGCTPLPMVAPWEHHLVGRGPTTQRVMVWVQRERFMGWACSECAWEFHPLGFPAGNTIAEMKDAFEQQCDAEFMSHVCSEHPKCKS